ncbi:DNA/RNA helicase [Microbacterium sp. cx-59]|uniref:DNA/RNA helicase n=1 Tax=Microbacterium sp. cx-59 TaxID=2891207 RepID=UPI001E37E663|nr:DNA/RNA helicase [Microbacterium sp. cx-59]MCC4907859.1 DNA/RNA helicase [Microbacterium sp. cx-59]
MSIRARLHPLGYIHRGDLVDAGWSAERIRRAVSEEGLLLIRRKWVVDPDADAAIRAAASRGARLTCVSAAAVRNVWVSDEPSGPHLWLPPHASASVEGLRVHRARPIVPAHPRSLVEPIENVLAAIAVCQPLDHARAAWESTVARGIATPEHLAAVTWPGTRARALSAEVEDLSDSGVETIGVARLRRAGVPVRQQVRLAGHDVDGLVGTHLVLQFDGLSFHRAAERRRDLAHDRALRLLGCTVFRYDYFQTIHVAEKMEREVLEAMAQGLHLAPLRAASASGHGSRRLLG